MLRLQKNRVFPTSVEGWKSVLQDAVAVTREELISPPHFQAYCINPKTKTVIPDLNYNSMLTASQLQHRREVVKRNSGVLVLLEPIDLNSSFCLKHKNCENNNNNNNNKFHLFSNELRTYVTLRHGHLRTHKGEIAYPGGKADKGETSRDAAIREASEEINADISSYDVIGELSRVYSFPSKSFVTPTVGVAKKLAENSPCVREHILFGEERRNKNKNKSKNKSSPEEEKSLEVNGDENKDFKKEDEKEHLQFQKWSPSSSSSSSNENENSEKSNNNNKNNNNDKIYHSHLQTSSSLNLKITSEKEVDEIDSLDICHLLLSSEGHDFIERQWRPPHLDYDQRWMLPAFDTSETNQMLWGLTGFVFCELLCRIAFVLQKIPLPENASEMEKKTKDQLDLFFKRASKHYVEKCGDGSVIGLPRHDEPVKFANPYDDIIE